MGSPGSGWQQRAICISRLPTPTTVNAELPLAARGGFGGVRASSPRDDSDAGTSSWRLRS